MQVSAGQTLKFPVHTDVANRGQGYDVEDHGHTTLANSSHRARVHAGVPPRGTTKHKPATNRYRTYSNNNNNKQRLAH